MADDRARPFLTAQWRHLAMFNYDIAPAVLRPLVPPHTELDDFDGRTLVSLVGFRFLDTRVLGIPIPFHRHFTEVNVRFYVRRQTPDGWHHGVVFIQELVPRRAIAWTAKAVYNEPYHTLPMRFHVNMGGPEQGLPGSVRYGWRFKGEWQYMDVATSGAPAQPTVESEAAFISTRGWGYGMRRDGRALEYRVRHPAWRVWSAERYSVGGDPAGLYGPSIADALGSTPSSVFVADGSAVSVYPAQTLS
jgi:uncharacterized protein YqjF (DUF2071 family)